MTPWLHWSRWWRTRYQPSVSKPSIESSPRLSGAAETLLKMTLATFEFETGPSPEVCQKYPACVVAEKHFLADVPDKWKASFLHQSL